MSSPSRVHAFVMAGGSGSRLGPLTAAQCKPALPFGGTHRVIDFVLGNLWNSQITRAELLVQYQPDTLLAHVRRTWPLSAAGEPFVRFAPPPAGSGRGRVGYLGTADAVHQNLQRLQAHDDDLVLVFGADHVYRMDVRQMIDFHRAQRADVTVATLPVSLAEARGFGVLQVDAGHAVTAFHEKPAHPPTMPGSSAHALASMGNYVFSYGALRRELQRAAAAGETDFGQHVLPHAIERCRVMAYDFHRNTVPGLAAHEEPGYWRDVGTLDAYFETQMDTLGSSPVFGLHSARWPLPQPPAGEPAVLTRSEARCSRFGRGARVERAALDQAVLGAHCRVERGAQVARSILFDRVVVGAGARLRQVIVDEDNVIPAGEVIGEDRARDAARFTISDAGVVIVPRGYFAADARQPAVAARPLPRGQGIPVAAREPVPQLLAG